MLVDDRIVHAHGASRGRSWSPTAASSTRFAPVLFLGTALFGLAVFVSSRPFDTDGWWHLSNGDLILDRGSIPSRDPFSWPAPSTSWRLGSWLYDLIAASVRRIAGLGAVSHLALAAFVALGVVCYLLTRRAGARGWPSVAAVVPVMMLMTQFFAERPQMFSYLLFAVAIVGARRALDGSNRALVGLGLLFLVWSNIHLAFSAGVGTLGLIALANAIRTRRLARPVLVVGVPAIAAFLNPYGMGAYTAALRVRADSRIIEEWRHANFHTAGDLVLFVLLALAVAAMWRSGRWRRIELTLPIVAFTALSVGAIRNVPFLLILLVTELALGFSQLPRLRLAPHQARALTHGSLLGIAIVVIAGLGGMQLRPAKNTTYAVRSTAAIPAGCRLLNEYSHGGYIIDHRGPEVRVSQDGRLLPGVRAVVAQDEVFKARPGWADWLDRNDVDCVLAQPTRPIVHKLEAMGWHLTARDPSGVLLLRP